MGKTQSKRSVDITTETKKGTEDEITEKMEKIEDLDKKEVVNGDATISEKSDPEKKDSEEVENDKDMVTEKGVDVQASGDAKESQNDAETLKGDVGSATAEEISPLADESIKKSKKEKVKKKWSFRSISFGKKDKQKPAKNEEAAEDGSAATNGADTDEKTITEREDTQKDKSANENEEKTTENHENGNVTPQELNGGEQHLEKTSDEKSIDIFANTTNNTTTTETCEPVQNEIAAAVSSELSEKTENTADIYETTKTSQNTTVDDASKNGNGINEKINATDQEAHKTDVIFVESSTERTSALASAVTNESSAATNGEVVDQIHQNGGHGEYEQEVVEKSMAQIEVNSNTDNKVSAATLDSISSNSINPTHVQIHLNASSKKPDEIIHINNDESVIQKSNSCTVEQSSLSEIVHIVEDVGNNIHIETVSDLTSEIINNKKSIEDKLGGDPSPPPLPISPPPSQVSVFAFTNNDEPVEDSNQKKSFDPTNDTLNKADKSETPPTLSEPIATETHNRQGTDAIPKEKFDDETTHDQVSQLIDDNINTNVEFQCQEDKEVEETSFSKTLKKDSELPTSDLFKISHMEEKASVDIAAAVINEITQIAAEIVNQQIKYNEEQITDEQLEQSREERNEEKEGIVVKSNDDNEDHNDENHVDAQEFKCEVASSSIESPIAPGQIDTFITKCCLDFSTSELLQQGLDEMISLKKSDNLDEELLDQTKEFATAKDIKDNVIVAEITQDLSVTCE